MHSVLVQTAGLFPTWSFSRWYWIRRKKLQ